MIPEQDHVVISAFAQVVHFLGRLHAL